MSENQSTEPTPRKPEIADYALLKLVGSGSYGEVWLARTVTENYCAIKIVYRDRFESDAPFERDSISLRSDTL